MTRRAGERLRGWRRIAAALWDDANDPQIYGALEVDASPIRAFIAEARAAGHHVTVTHVVGRGVAHALKEVPDLNVRITGGRAYPRDSVELFFLTAVGGGDLSGVKIADAEEKSAVEIARELDRRGRTLKRGEDPGFGRTKRMMEALPMWILRPMMRVSAWLAGERAIALPALGVEATPFGSAMITSIGMMGLPTGFAPLTWMYKCPLLVLAGEIADKPVAVDGRVEVRPMLPLTATIDHRYADGWHIARFVKAFRAYLDAPAAFEPRVDRAEAALQPDGTGAPALE